MFNRLQTQGALTGLCALVLLAGILHVSRALALTQTENRSVNVTAIVPGPPPSTPAIITSPLDGSKVSVAPIVITGTCQPALLVRVYSNGNVIGTTTCSIDGTFTINATLYQGKNALTALNFDTLNQPGPVSASVIVLVQTESADSRPRNKQTKTPTSTNKPNPDLPPLKPGTTTDKAKNKLSAGTVTKTLALFWALTALACMILLLIRRVDKSTEEQEAPITNDHDTQHKTQD